MDMENRLPGGGARVHHGTVSVGQFEFVRQFRRHVVQMPEQHLVVFPDFAPPSRCAPGV